jgi:hypothetical protein
MSDRKAVEESAGRILYLLERKSLIERESVEPTRLRSCLEYCCDGSYELKSISTVTHLLNSALFDVTSSQ